MTDILEGFAARLRVLRREKNFSQTDLGRLVDLHYTHIGRYERGLSLPSSDTLMRLAEALGVTSDFLLHGEPEKAAGAVAGTVAKLKDGDLLKQFQEVEQLSDEDKYVIKKILDAFLLKKQLQALTR